MGNREDYGTLQQQYAQSPNIDNSQYMHTENPNVVKVPSGNQVNNTSMDIEASENNRVNTNAMPGFLRNTAQFQNFNGNFANIQARNPQYTYPNQLTNTGLTRQYTNMQR